MTWSIASPWRHPARPPGRASGWPSDPQARIRWLEEHQRNLEQRAADVADRIRQLTEASAGGPGEGHRRRTARSRSSSRQRYRRTFARTWPGARFPFAPPAWRPGLATFAVPGMQVRTVSLPDGSHLSVRELAGPPQAPTLMLLHGWGGTAVGNWATAVTALAREFHVVAPDLPGHDHQAVEAVAALADALGLERVIAVGYSLGSAVAYQLWRHHPELVEGLVLCAAAGVPVRRSSEPELEPEQDDIPIVPTAVVVTQQDMLVPAGRQLELARSLPDASVHPVDGSHTTFARYQPFVPVLLEACHSVADRTRGDAVA